MTHTDLEDELSRSLHARADGLTASPITLDAVKGTATTIRRRRRGASFAAVAAVVALAVPLGAQLAPSPDRAPEPVEPAPTPRPDGTFRLGLRQLSPGDRPGVPYALGTTLVTPGTEIELDDRYLQVVQWGEGHLAVAARGSDADGRFSFRLVRLDASYDEVEELTAAAPVIALSPDRSQVAWVEPAGDRADLVVGSVADAAQQWRAELPAAYAQPVGFLPDGRVAVGLDQGDSYISAFAAVGPDGRTEPIDGFQRLADVDPTGQLVGQTDYRDATGVQCSGARDLAGTLLWERCGLELGALSPDGRYVLGFDTGEVAGASTFLSVLDAATGDPVLELTSGKGAGTYASDPVWEDQDTVLAVVEEGAEEAIVRFELDGRAEQATSTVTGGGGMGVRHQFVVTPRPGL